MNNDNLLFFMFFMIILINGIYMYKSVDLKKNDSRIEYAAFIYSILMMVLSSFGLLTSVVSFILVFLFRER